jgi:hypothetical protein
LRQVVERINERIRYVNSHTVSGPPTTVWTVDPEPIVERWRAGRPSEPIEVPGAPSLESEVAPPASRRRRFRRLLGRPD